MCVPASENQCKAVGTGDGKIWLTFGNVVGDLERVGRVLEGDEGDELDHLAELGDVIERVLHRLGEVPNLFVEIGRKEGESGRGLEEDLQGPPFSVRSPLLTGLDSHASPFRSKRGKQTTLEEKLIQI